MKKFMLLSASITLMLLSTITIAQRFSVTPEKPLPGETLTVHYNPAGSSLEALSSFASKVFLYIDDSPNAEDLNLVLDGDKYAGTVKTTAETKAVLFSFKNEEADAADNNDGKGYKVLFYQDDRISPVQGAYAAKADIYYGRGTQLGNVKSNTAKALDLLKKEFNMFPLSKGNEKLWASYSRLAVDQKDEAAIAEVKSKIASLTAPKKATEDQLWLAYNLCSTIKDDELKNATEARLRKSFPKGKIAKSDLMKSFNEAKEIADKVAVYEKLKKGWGHEKDAQPTLDYWAMTIAQGYSKADDLANFEKYLGMIGNKSTKANALNNAAWAMSGESIEAEGKNLEKAKAYSNASLMLIGEEMENPSGKPTYITLGDWKKNKMYTYAMYADTYAMSCYKTGSPEEALQYQQISCETNKFADLEMNERYCVYFEKVKGGKEAEKALARFISEGTASAKMKEQHKRIFLANNNLESAYSKYLTMLEAKALATKKEKLKEKMMDEKAPSFSLVNLKGETVSLESLSGKVVVVDFWATWCGPCKASFPAMQKAVNNYADNKDVEFVFVDTWEQAKDKAKNAADFIESKSYTFNVLMDNNDEVVAKFGVNGIPTKFVIDKKGKIRFKSVGYGGNEEELVNELNLMIEIAGGSAPVKLAGAP